MRAPMPPDVLLMLASSGITLVASLMFFVSDDAPPAIADDPRNHVTFCLPPLRQSVRALPVAQPPPVPSLEPTPPPLPECKVDVSNPMLASVMTLKPASNEEWVLTLECAPQADSAALQIRGKDGVGAVTDLRWHGKAGLARTTKRQWKMKPGRC